MQRKAWPLTKRPATSFDLLFAFYPFLRFCIFVCIIVLVKTHMADNKQHQQKRPQIDAEKNAVAFVTGYSPYHGNLRHLYKLGVWQSKPSFGKWLLIFLFDLGFLFFFFSFFLLKFLGICKHGTAQARQSICYSFQCSCLMACCFFLQFCYFACLHGTAQQKAREASCFYSRFSRLVACCLYRHGLAYNTQVAKPYFQFLFFLVCFTCLFAFFICLFP